jgi:hypothetical protein
MRNGDSPYIVALDRMRDGLCLYFNDGQCAFYSDIFLHSQLKYAQKLSDLLPTEEEPESDLG